MDVLDIPGYIAAIRKERVVRDAAFLGITESIGPFEVLPLTLYHYTILRLARSPFLTDRVPTPQETADFLWLLSPGFQLGQSRAKKRFLRRCRSLFFPPRYMALLNTKRARARFERKHQARLTVAAQIIDSIRAFMAEAQQDRPPIPASLGYDPEYYSDAAYFCAIFGREFGWCQDQTLHMPMKRLYQYLNELKHAHGSRVPLCNPSDGVRAAYLRDLNQRNKTN